MSDKTLDEVYEQRTDLFLLAMRMAQKLDYETGIRDNDGEWVVLSIELPTGQISIHAQVKDIPLEILNGSKAKEYDGHTDKEKKLRILSYLK
jgi:hypothetical protein